VSAKDVINRLVGSLARPTPQRSAERLATLLRTLVSQRGEASGAVLPLRIGPLLGFPRPSNP